MKCLVLFLSLIICIAHPMSSAQAQTDESSLKLPRTLPAHPRLMLTPSVKARVARLLETDAKAQQFFERIHQGAKLIAKTPPIVRKLEGDKRKRMLGTARLALHNIVTMGLSHAFAPDDAMRDRIIAEMLSAVDFVDWHPSHFLDTSEMTLAITFRGHSKDFICRDNKISIATLAEKLPANQFTSCCGQFLVPQ